MCFRLARPARVQNRVGAITQNIRPAQVATRALASRESRYALRRCGLVWHEEGRQHAHTFRNVVMSGVRQWRYEFRSVAEDLFTAR